MNCVSRKSERRPSLHVTEMSGRFNLSGRDERKDVCAWQLGYCYKFIKGEKGIEVNLRNKGGIRPENPYF